MSTRSVTTNVEIALDGLVLYNSVIVGLTNISSYLYELNEAGRCPTLLCTYAGWQIDFLLASYTETRPGNAGRQSMSRLSQRNYRWLPCSKTCHMLSGSTTQLFCILYLLTTTRKSKCFDSHIRLHCVSLILFSPKLLMCPCYLFFRWPPLPASEE